MNMKKGVLVTGAAGFIASHLIDSLLHSGIEVLGVDNFDPFYGREKKLANIEHLQSISRQTGVPFSFRELDINTIDSNVFAEYEISSILHLAGKAGVRPSLIEPEAFLRANVNGTLRLLEFSKDRKIKDFVFGSSSSVYGNDTPVPFSESAPADKPISPYAASKRSCELYCDNYARLYGMRIASLRFFTVYGPRQRPDLAIHKFTRALLANRTIEVFGDGSTSRDYTFVTDIIDGIRKALNWLESANAGTHEIFNLGGSSPVKLIDLIRVLESKTQVEAKLEYVGKQQGDVERTYANIEKSRQFLKYSPQVDLNTGIAAFVDWARTTT